MMTLWHGLQMALLIGSMDTAPLFPELQSCPCFKVASGVYCRSVSIGFFVEDNGVISPSLFGNEETVRKVRNIFPDVKYRIEIAKPDSPSDIKDDDVKSLLHAVEGWGLDSTVASIASEHGRRSTYLSVRFAGDVNIGLGHPEPVPTGPIPICRTPAAALGFVSSGLVVDIRTCANGDSRCVAKITDRALDGIDGWLRRSLRVGVAAVYGRDERAENIAHAAVEALVRERPMLRLLPAPARPLSPSDAFVVIFPLSSMRSEPEIKQFKVPSIPKKQDTKNEKRKSTTTPKHLRHSTP